MSAEVEKVDVLVRVDWGKKSNLSELLLSELQNAIIAKGASPRSFECPSLDALQAIVLFAPFADPAMDVIEVNGIECQVAKTPVGGFGFVPVRSVDGVEILATSSASWLPGGPCEMAQEETIYRFRDLYWVEAQGDTENQRVIAGLFEAEKDGVLAAARVSAYFTADVNGALSCELDEWS